MSQITTRPRPQLGDEAASYVRDQITSGTLAAGTHVRPEAVASELGISSTPAREALQALRSEGFLNLAPRRGFTVARITGDDIRDMFLVQSWVAGELAARAATRGGSEAAQRMTAIHEELTAAAGRGDLTGLEEQNHLFHREINLASNAPRLAWVIQLVSRYAPSRFYATIDGWPQTTVDDHSGILDAIRAGDAERARDAMQQHVLRAGEQLARHIDARLSAEPGESLPA
ncbi:GntR family transcriptional regulator [Agrococcus baldri]|uniref:GntR family transcriptional regulator n=1 Tax=Agrococcus baldri TaxID=153730 RepID=A0AA87UYU9_9MICO|nr:GntR family transcriptional regulator [Agrococcus baldri]GEK81662.1 GntR family transcriptional regulator [Agrococcus baldri]